MTSIVKPVARLSFSSWPSTPSADGRKSFHHLLTPEDSVAQAAVASAAIPIYFPPVGRRVDAEHTEVLFDGGTWSNFPVWIYKDPSFRAFHRHQLEEEENPPQDGAFGASPLEQNGSREGPFVVGFLLDEEAPLPGGWSGAPSGEGEREKQWSDLTAGEKALRGIGYLARGSLWAFTSPIYVLFLFIWLLSLTIVSMSTLFDAWPFHDVHAFLRPAALGHVWIAWIVVWAIGVVYQGTRFWTRKPSGLYIPANYWKWEFVGSVLAGVPLLFAWATLRVSPKAHEGHLDLDDQGPLKWIVVTVSVGGDGACSPHDLRLVAPRSSRCTSGVGDREGGCRNAHVGRLSSLLGG